MILFASVPLVIIGHPFWSVMIIAMDVVTLYGCAPAAAAPTWKPLSGNGSVPAIA